MTNLLEALREASAKATWQNISTAPKDGSDMILAKYGWTPIVDGLEPGSPEWRWRIFDEAAPREYRLFWLTKGHWSKDWQNWNDGSEPCGLAEPTHWRPLPEMPRHEQTAWLIERYDLRDEVLYFARRGDHYWTPDHAKAWRFPDEETARIACNGGDAPGGLLKVVEHAWVSAPPRLDCNEIIAALEERERLREALTRLRVAASILQNNSELCAVNHYGHSFEEHGRPMWLTDTAKDITFAEDVLGSAALTGSSDHE